MRIAVGFVIAIAFFGALAFATLKESSITCEVCLEFDGKSACRTSSGGTREYAVYGARSGACAVLSSGVTGGLKCERAQPTRVTCTP